MPMTKEERLEMMAGNKAVEICKRITNSTISDLEKERAITKVCSKVYLMNRLSKTDLLAVLDWVFTNYMEERNEHFY